MNKHPTHNQGLFADYRALWGNADSNFYDVIAPHGQQASVDGVQGGGHLVVDNLSGNIDGLVHAIAIFAPERSSIVGEESADFTPHTLSHHHNDNTVQLHHGEKPAVIIPVGHDW